MLAVFISLCWHCQRDRLRVYIYICVFGGTFLNVGEDLVPRLPSDLCFTHPNRKGSRCVPITLPNLKESSDFFVSADVGM